eukprot:gb/GECG01004825.1/.p1 GENE.gb/GECG01004825.1/~~gb/GECG01004825.1/.p1  ORF type:complete len:111 (+),score=5.24 gb/GECG01004825.1/:1-333(+)
MTHIARPVQFAHKDSVGSAGSGDVRIAHSLSNTDTVSVWKLVDRDDTTVGTYESLRSGGFLNCTLRLALPGGSIVPLSLSVSLGIGIRACSLAFYTQQSDDGCLHNPICM